jgi:RNA-directed DNA polymerase
MKRTASGWVTWKRPKRRLRAFRQLGVKESWARRYAYSRKGGWRIANSQIMRMTVTDDRLCQRGYIPFVEYYLKLKQDEKKPRPRRNRK